MTYGYKNDEICDDCEFEKSSKCDSCYNHMRFHRKQESINRYEDRLEKLNKEKHHIKEE